MPFERLGSLDDDVPPRVWVEQVVKGPFCGRRDNIVGVAAMRVGGDDE